MRSRWRAMPGIEASGVMIVGIVGAVTALCSVMVMAAVMALGPGVGQSPDRADASSPHTFGSYEHGAQ
jgi:hypothetical protein